MEPFETLFTRAGGQPIKYKGKTLIIDDILHIRHGDVFRVILETFNGDWRQGVSLAVPNGAIAVGTQQFSKGIILWEDTAPRETQFSIILNHTRPDKLYVHNVWHTGVGGVQYGHNCAAMWLEECQDGSKRYHCNDGYPDDDFDDAIFRIDRLPDSSGLQCAQPPRQFVTR